MLLPLPERVGVRVRNVSSLLPYPFDNIVLSVSLLGHFTPFATGAIYASDVGFFVSFILLGLFLGVRALARR